MMISTQQFVSLLPLLVDHPRITLGKSLALTVTREPWKVALRAVLEPSGEILLSLGEKAAAPTLIEGEWVLRNRTLQPSGLPMAYLGVLEGPVKLARAAVPQFLNQDWPQLMAGCDLEADFQPGDFKLEPQSPRFLLELKGGLAQLQALLQCAYGVRIMTLGVTSKEERFWLPDPVSATRYSTRDLAAEQGALGRLLRAGFSGPDGMGVAVRALCSALDYAGIDYSLRTFADIRTLRGF